jgi:Protein of unknown function (DUF4254)
MLDARQITCLQEDATAAWHLEQPLDADKYQLHDEFNALVLAQHRANYHLWHQEDKVRDPIASDQMIAIVKHSIDRLNQERNDAVQEIDTRLLTAAGHQNPAAALHSETPGLMIDRLSILALKVYHTAEEVHRPSASDAHHQMNLVRLALLQEQRADLAACLETLWTEVLQGNRRFKLYRQMKMYNDPELNPMMYAHKVPEEPS